MLNGQRYSFTERTDSFGRSSIMPYLPLTLINRNRLEVTALLDTGASVNVLPYEIGVQLGAVWEEQPVPIQLRGIWLVAKHEAWCYLVKLLSFHLTCLHLPGLNREMHPSSSDT